MTSENSVISFVHSVDDLFVFVPFFILIAS